MNVHAFYFYRLIVKYTLTFYLGLSLGY